MSNAGVVNGGNYVWGISYYLYFAGAAVSLFDAILILPLKKKARLYREAQERYDREKALERETLGTNE